MSDSVRDRAVQVTVSEVFGPTVQGEGPTAGRRCSFVRFGRCNLDCRWCDTPYTWDSTRYDLSAEMSNRSVRDVLLELEHHDTDRLVITGGEPMLQQKAIVALLDEGWFTDVEIETNGTVRIGNEMLLRVRQSIKSLRFNVSPKLASSGVADKLRKMHPDYPGLVSSGNGVLKFVITHDQHDADLAEVDALVDAHLLDRDRIWLMPEATNQWQLTSRLATVASAAVSRGYNVSGRLHVATWGDTRGV